MKNTKLTLALALALSGMVAASPLVRAADEKKDEPKAQPGGGKRTPADQLKRLTEALMLTDDQVAKLKPIFEEQAAKMQALREDTSIDQQEKMGKFRELMQSYQPKIRAVLTDEQKEKYDKFIESQKGKFKKKKDQ